MLKLAGRHFCVPFADHRDDRICHEIGQSVMLDNGAYSVWRSGREIDWSAWADWAERWLDYPTTWAVLPDSIEGDDIENDRLLEQWYPVTGHTRGAPVWHLHESIRRLLTLCHDFDRVCFGSSGAYAEVGSDAWHRRVSEAFDAISDDRGRVPWIHMLRGMKLTDGPYPFASLDSTNAARNHAGSWRQRPRPVAEMVAEMDAVQCPGRWEQRGQQLALG